MKKLIAISIAACLAATAASAKVSFSLAIEELSNGDNPINDSGLVVLVVDTGGDGFQLPSDGNLASGNDEVVTYWDLADYEFGSSNSVTLLTEGGVEWGSNWSAEDKLALFWFPTLDGSNLSPGAETIYGVFADAANLASGDAWRLPVDGTLLHSLKLFTAAASELVQSGSGDQPDAMGATAFAINNPPSTAAPGTPSLGIQNGGGQSTLTWTATGSTGGYIVQRNYNGEGWKTIGTTDGGTGTFVDTDVKPGRSYEYRLYSVGTFATATSPDLPPIVSARSILVNISARASVDNERTLAPYRELNAGVQIYGNDPVPFKKLMALGFGPFRNRTIGVNTWVRDTLLKYEVDGTTIGENDDWLVDGENPGNANPDALEISDVMANVGSPVFDPDFDTKDSVMLEEVGVNTPSLFKATSLDGSGYIGVGLFDADYERLNTNRIVNLSTRGYLEENGLFVGGLVIRGDVPKEILAVVAGPFIRDARGSRADLVLENPRMDVQLLDSSKGNPVLVENNDWDTQDGVPQPSNGLLAVETDIERLSRVLEAKNFQVDDMSLDSAVLVTLEPGRNYLFRVYAEDDGVSRPEGSALVALWEIEMD